MLIQPRCSGALSQQKTDSSYRLAAGQQVKSTGNPELKCLEKTKKLYINNINTYIRQKEIYKLL